MHVVIVTEAVHPEMTAISKESTLIQRDLLPCLQIFAVYLSGRTCGEGKTFTNRIRIIISKMDRTRLYKGFCQLNLLSSFKV